MPAIILEGDTLGKRQQHYNKFLKETIADIKFSKPGILNPEETDVENLLKIDIASNNRDVEYILEVLKSEDMLYVSRAIKRCTWLITDQQYAHIINPEYLYNQLFPHMTSRASNKLMLHIRLNLKEESRVEAFYNYYSNKDPNSAYKWLQYCSLPFIKKEVEAHHNDMRDTSLTLLKRLCERSITVLEMLCKLNFNNYFKRDILAATLFLINKHTEEYLDIVESSESYYQPIFGAKATGLIMKKCPQRIVDNFDQYANKIDLETFAKQMKKEEIKDFLLKQAEKDNFRSWFTFDNLKYFARHMPKEGRFNFLKMTFIEKAQKDDGDKMEPFLSDSIQLCCAMSKDAPSSSANIYRWYRFAPFDVAFPDLKKLIRSESSPVERNAMLAVLVFCAGRNLQHTQSVMQYYHDKHINEPFKFKVQFVNIVLSQTATHKYDEKTWNILNNIFCSMEVYIESNNNVQSCIESIIVYKVLHNEKIPEVIEKKFKFSSLKSKQATFSSEEKEKIFNYLLSFLKTKLQNETINNETELKEAVTLLNDVVSLLIDWKRDLLDYPWVLNIIKELSKKQKENSWEANLLSLFNMKKSWRKFMFEESLIMSPTEEACLNALKHDPELLIRHKSEVDALQRNDEVSLKRLLRKLRIYWPQSLARDWADSYLERLEQQGGHKSLARGLCILLPQKRLLEVLKTYEPAETKINWSEDDELVLSLRKHLANNAHLARPLFPPYAVLPYAQGDYLQHALPSLNAILYNVSSARSREIIPKFLDAPVSLQKHGIRLAFTKLKSAELKQTLPDIWKSTKNLSIRSVLFKTTYDLLCKEETPSMVEEIWEILCSFIDNLSVDENKIIFEILGKVDKVPLLVRSKYCMKSYKFLKTLPAKANCERIIQNVIQHTVKIMEFLDEDFVADILLESLEKKFTSNVFVHGQVMSSYLLCAKDEESQIKRYERVLVPLLKHSFAMWDVKVEEKYFVRRNVSNLLNQFSRDFRNYVFEKDMVYPIKMFTDIQNKLEEKLSLVQYYVMLRFWKLAVGYVKTLEGQKSLVSTIRKTANIRPMDDYNYGVGNEIWDEVYIKASTDFSEICRRYLREDIETYSSSTWLIFADSLEQMFSIFDLSQMALLQTLESLLCEEFLESYLLALKVMPLHYYSGDEEKKKSNEIRQVINSHPSPQVKMHYYREFSCLDL